MSELAAEVERLREELDRDYDVDGIVAADPRMLEVLETVQKVAPTSATVMIYGESGTGKELVARAIHRLSTARHQAVRVGHAPARCPRRCWRASCSATRRAPSPARCTAKPGRFELANGGTLFLDEIGDITPAVQVKLLRVLQERTFERLGGTRTIEVDVRVVAATNRDLQQLIADGDVPRGPLLPAQRRADRRCRRCASGRATSRGWSRTSWRSSTPARRRIAPEALQALSEYQWPGNIRELENTIERIVILSKGDEIDVERPARRGPRRASRPVRRRVGAAFDAPRGRSRSRGGRARPGPAGARPRRRQRRRRPRSSSG